MTILKKSLAADRQIAFGIVAGFCLLTSLNSLLAQQKVDKRNPSLAGNSGSFGSIETASASMGNTDAAVAGTGIQATGGFSNQNGSESSGCICPQNVKRKKLFRRKCRLHPNFDPAMIPNPFEEIPLGLQLNETMKAQVRNYENTRQILYRYDFIDGTAKLNDAGRAKLQMIARNAFTNFAPIVVESTPRQPGLDHARRLQLAQTITNNAIPIPAERIIVGGAPSRGLAGPDALILYNRSLSDLNQGAQGMSGSASSSVGGLSGSGLLPNMQQAGGGGNQGN